MESTLRHASHSHELQRMGLSETNGKASSCRACSQPFKSDTVLYGCCDCGYFLHRTCAKLSKHLQRHPAHSDHQLDLCYAPTDTVFCNICGNRGGGFSYRCESCNFIAHSFCVQLPERVRSPLHNHHVRLSYRPRSKRSTHCGACHDRIRHACYSCRSCIFDLHTGCIRQEVGKPGRLKGLRRAKAKEFIKKHAGGIVIAALKIGAVVGLSALGVEGAEAAGEAEGNEDAGAECDGEDVGDDAECDGDTVGDDPDIGDDGGNNFTLDTGTFYDLPPCDPCDYKALQDEAAALVLAHMEGTGAGGTVNVPPNPP